MKKKIFTLALGILLISLNAFADGSCNLAGSSNAGGIYLNNVLIGFGTDDSPYFFANTGRKLYFGTNGSTTPIMMIDTTGNVGIGTTTPAAKLDVNGNVSATNLNVSGNVGIGTETPAQKLSVAGTIESTSGGIKFPDGTIQTTKSKVVQVVNYSSGNLFTSNAIIPKDDTIPQKTEGAQWATLTITPQSATNKLMIDVVINVGFEVGTTSTIIALFQDNTANALNAKAIYNIDDSNGSNQAELTLKHFMTAGTTNETTFKVRIGSGTSKYIYVNGSRGARQFGGVCISSITITEIAP